jgi:FkbM family methyltransferase
MKNNAYHPSPLNISKYATYTDYLLECYRNKDWQSIKDSFRYVLFRTPPTTDRLVKSRMGTFWCRANTNDFQYVNYAYERSVKDYLQRNIKSYNYFFDIGACMGEYCVWLAQQGIRCVAFEPVPMNYKALAKNVEINNMQNLIRTYPVGLGSKEEEVYFDIKPVLTSASGIDRTYTGPEKNVKIKRLDDLIPELGCSPKDGIMMKLDVEGMEVEVLKGGENFLKSARKLTLILEKTFSGENSIRDYLATIGNFRYEDIDEVNIAAIRQ